MKEEWLFFEDLQIGDVVDSPGQTVTEAHVIRYVGLTGEWDERTTNEEYARSRAAGDRQVPDLLPVCLSSGLGWRVPRLPLAILAFMGFEGQFLHPIRIGDTIWTRARTMAKRAVKEGGIVIEQREILNQHGEVVQSCRLTLLVARRPTP
ncbi:MAG: MaoC family dehydratase N-terminal domain-containing protein [Candidatus Methylomirabilia bacterium]